MDSIAGFCRVLHTTQPSDQKYNIAGLPRENSLPASALAALIALYFPATSHTMVAIENIAKKIIILSSIMAYIAEFRRGLAPVITDLSVGE